ncbi:hypothetical protein JKP88DRAFT_273088 [Tribonema minus]|uniref:Uncharacterized protein n=1 Tax=Tribonema minus TaxID=303371 RepID=A0A836CFB9_9STRA|nr:hypothetical protein JKP88DRAFT_273088 [Tribonema minus]
MELRPTLIRSCPAAARALQILQEASCTEGLIAYAVCQRPGSPCVICLGESHPDDHRCAIDITAAASRIAADPECCGRTHWYAETTPVVRRASPSAVLQLAPYEPMAGRMAEFESKFAGPGRDGLRYHASDLCFHMRERNFRDMRGGVNWWSWTRHVLYELSGLFGVELTGLSTEPDAVRRVVVALLQQYCQPEVVAYCRRILPPWHYTGAALDCLGVLADALAVQDILLHRAADEVVITYWGAVHTTDQVNMLRACGYDVVQSAYATWQEYAHDEDGDIVSTTSDFVFKDAPGTFDAASLRNLDPVARLAHLLAVDPSHQGVMELFEQTLTPRARKRLEAVARSSTQRVAGQHEDAYPVVAPFAIRARPDFFSAVYGLGTEDRDRAIMVAQKALFFQFAVRPASDVQEWSKDADGSTPELAGEAVQSVAWHSHNLARVLAEYWPSEGVLIAMEICVKAAFYLLPNATPLQLDQFVEDMSRLRQQGRGLPLPPESWFSTIVAG